MAEIAAFPNLQTLTPWVPPVAPFHWRPINKGPAVFEYLFDSHGHQLFRGSSAVWRKAEPTPDSTPKREPAHG